MANIYFETDGTWRAQAAILGKRYTRSFRDYTQAKECQDWLNLTAVEVRSGEITPDEVRSELEKRWPKRPGGYRKKPTMVNPWTTNSAAAAKIADEAKAKSHADRLASMRKHSPETTVGTLVAAITMPDRVRIRFASKNAKVLKTKANHIDRKQIEKMRRLVVHDHNWQFQPVWAGLVKQLEAR